MGGRVQKIAFIIFALLFVAIMAVLNTSVLNMATSSNKTLTTTVTTSDSSSLNVYDNTSVYGSTVQECAKKPNSIVSSSLSVLVCTTGSMDDSSGSGGYVAYTGDNPYNENNAGNPAYINPNSMFNSNLLTNSNGVTVGILFYQDGVTAPDSVDVSALGTITNGENLPDGYESWQIAGIDADADDEG